MADPEEGEQDRGPHDTNSHAQTDFDTWNGLGLSSAANGAKESEQLNTVELRGNVDQAVPQLLEAHLRSIAAGWYFFSVDHYPAVGRDGVQLQCTIDQMLLSIVQGYLGPIAERHRVSSLEYRLTVSQVDRQLGTATLSYVRQEWRPLPT